MNEGESHRLSPIYHSSTDDSVLHLFFYYLMNLNIMTVKTKVSTSTDVSTAISAGWVSPERPSMWAPFIHRI